jgi:hypothetical protein
VLARGQRQVQRLLEVGAPAGVPGAPERGAEVVQGVGQYHLVVDLAPEPDRQLGVLHRLLAAAGEHRELGQVAVRQGELLPVVAPVEDDDRLLARLLGQRPLADPPGDPGQPAQRDPELRGVAERAKQLYGLRLVGERAATEVAHRVALDRRGLQERGQLADVERLSVPEHHAVVGRGLPVRTTRGRRAGGARPEAHDCGRVARLGGVVHEQRGIGTAGELQGLQGVRVEHGAPC